MCDVVTGMTQEVKEMLTDFGLNIAGNQKWQTIHLAEYVEEEDLMAMVEEWGPGGRAPETANVALSRNF